MPALMRAPPAAPGAASEFGNMRLKWGSMDTRAASEIGTPLEHTSTYSSNATPRGISTPHSSTAAAPSHPSGNQGAARKSREAMSLLRMLKARKSVPPSIGSMKN